MSMALDDRRRRAAKDLLHLLTRQERDAVCASLGLEVREGLKASEEVDAIAAGLSRLPRHRVLAELLAVAKPLASMLQDIVSFLERHEVAARTKGFALGLAHPTARLGMNTIDLSPQEVGMICSWPTKTLRKLGEDPFEAALRAWRSLRPGWAALLDRSRTRVESGVFDPLETAIEHRRSIIEGRIDTEPLKYEAERDSTDYEAQDVLRHLLERVEQTHAVLRRIPPAERAASAHLLIRALNALLADGERSLHAASRRTAQARGPSATRALGRTLATYRRRRFPTKSFFDDFDSFEEDIRALADLAEADAFLDALRLDLWSNRPQLFEVWVLVSILDWMERRGYDVKLLRVEPSPTGRPVWQLKYSGESQACAKVSGDCRSEFVFYQLFQSAKESGKEGAMPDLALLRGPSEGAPRVWAIDPKLSMTYRREDYERTAWRYLTGFGAPLAVVVEYFPRKGDNPLKLGEGAWLVTDVRPSGKGFPHVLDKIRASHPPLRRIVLCVDMSSSFEARRRLALRVVAATLAGQIDAVADVYVCFAGDAEATAGMHDFLRSGGTAVLQAPQLSPGTAVGPLIHKLQDVIDGHGPIRVEVIGDGEFDEPGWIERMAMELGADVRLQA